SARGIIGYMFKLLVICCCLLSCLSACKSREETAPKTEARGPEIVIGLIPEQNIFAQMDRYEQLSDYLSAKMGRPIRWRVVPHYGTIIDYFRSSGVDGAFLGSFSYVLVHAKAGADVLVRAEDLYGRSTSSGVIIVRRDSGIKSAKDMKGKRFAFVDKATTAGYLLPLAYFKKMGIENYNAYFKEVYFAGTYTDAINDVIDRKADIAAVKNTVFEKVEDTGKRGKKELLILEKFPEEPESGLVVRKGLDPALKKELKQVLLNMYKDPDGQNVLEKFGARRFIETTDEDYKLIYDYVGEIGINLNTFDYAGKK
ncbi:MAG TPA: phosphate/phosphite/phosphonate ABC transporter substrate-binding protein, partial [Dissulfurispiraceae bacterium]|nr:phosphate/phosphite/phosphonate ABC transporter substrate-binding protein [Dissulfurispiraceae bacterium]